MTTQGFQQRYSLQPGFYADDLVGEIDALWADLRQPGSGARKGAERLKIDVTDLPERAPITVTQDGAGFDPATVAVIVAVAPLVLPFAKLTARVLEDLWTHVLLPRILQRKGEHALKPAPHR